MELVIKEAIDMFYVKEFERLTGYVHEKDERIWQLIQQNREQDIELRLLRKVTDALGHKPISGFTPTTPLEQALVEYLDWKKDHELFPLVKGVD
jgi:hypothetical protein